MSVALYRQPNHLPVLADDASGEQEARFRTEWDAMLDRGEISLAWSATTVLDALRLARWFGWQPDELGCSAEGHLEIGAASARGLADALKRAVALGRDRFPAHADRRGGETTDGAYWERGATWLDDDGAPLLLLVDDEGRSALEQLAGFAAGGAFTVE